MSVPHISVCICTYRRPEWLRRLLQALQRQQTEQLFDYSIVVADNDAAESARATIAEFSAGVPLVYCLEPEKNIALGPHRSVASSAGNWIAFIDDDEFPESDWLLKLFQTAKKYDVAGVLAPVRPHFDTEPPAWVYKCGLYDRPEHETGFVLSWQESRTGNVLFRRDIIPPDAPPFAAGFHNGGEDQDFFRRMMGLGHRFIWCNEAAVHETVPPIRWDRRVLMQRALLRGKNSLKHGDAPGLSLAKSVVAVPLYAIILPVAAILGMHFFMRYLIKLCDHLGRVLAALGINPVRERVG